MSRGVTRENMPVLLAEDDDDMPMLVPASVDANAGEGLSDRGKTALRAVFRRASSSSSRSEKRKPFLRRFSDDCGEVSATPAAPRPKQVVQSACSTV